MALLLASVWLLLPPFVLLFPPGLAQDACLATERRDDGLRARGVGLDGAAVSHDERGKLHLLASPDGRHTFIITNDSMLPQGNYSVFESTGGVVFHRNGDINTESGEDFLSHSRSTVRWDRDSVIITTSTLTRNERRRSVSIRRPSAPRSGESARHRRCEP